MYISGQLCKNGLLTDFIVSVNSVNNLKQLLLDSLNIFSLYAHGPTAKIILKEFSIKTGDLIGLCLFPFECGGALRCKLDPKSPQTT